MKQFESLLHVRLPRQAEAVCQQTIYDNCFSVCPPRIPDPPPPPASLKDYKRKWCTGHDDPWSCLNTNSGPSINGSNPRLKSSVTITTEGNNSTTVIAVSIVIPIVLILLALAAVLWHVKRRKIADQKNAANTYNLSYLNKPQVPTRTDNDDTEGMEQLICSNIRAKLEDMYIDPSNLHFDLSSNSIGKGYFSNVYRGQLRVKDNVLKTVAVKALKDTADVDVSQLENFLHEASFVKYYKHVNVLITLGVVWIKRDRPYVVLPYMAYGDLRTLIKRPEMEFTVGDLVHFGVQVATGMEYLTEQRCIHRDLAARNCLVNETFVVKIGDFGMSKDIYIDNYYRESLKRKPKPIKWMALESLEDGTYDSQTEVWSYGVLLWELFTRGGEPYPALNNHEVFDYLKIGHRLRCPTYTHPQVFQEISKCWDIEPSARPTFTHLKKFFQKLLKGGFNDLPPVARDQMSIGDNDFYYSYARSLTLSIPDGYAESDHYDDERLCVEYCDYDYEPPLPSTDSTIALQPSRDLFYCNPVSDLAPGHTVESDL